MNAHRLIESSRAAEKLNQFGKFLPSRESHVLEPLIAAKAKENQVASGELFGKGCQKSDNPINPIDTKKEVAKAANVSHDTVADHHRD